ncbi:lysozyme [Yokenella regensburgei]|uniref:lysozyme n=1 Tax=Yokenella regensburgei TaxID=158877 RepID=UPI003ED8F7CD
MNTGLRKTLTGAVGGGAIAVAAVLIPHLEGTEYQPYRDVGGVWTVCNGITGPDVTRGKTYTLAECDALLQKHLKPYADSVNRTVIVPASEYQKAALISFSFNIGIDAFEHSSVLRNLNAGKYQQACDGLRHWVYVDRMKVRGLMNRREVEREICLWGQK